MNEYGYDCPMSQELMVSSFLDHLIGSFAERHVTLGGELCKKNVPQSDTGKAKRAQPDLSYRSTNGAIVFVEVDEADGHTGYGATCELSRYDTLSYGTSTESKVYSTFYNT